MSFRELKVYSLSFGVDIDNVVSKTDETIRLLIRRRYGIDVKRGDVTQFDYHKCKHIPLTKQQVSAVLEEFHHSACRDVGIVHGAKEALFTLHASSHRICLVTSRHAVAKKSTRKWLNERAICYDELVFSKHKDSLVGRIDYFVEDNGAVAKRLAGLGGRVFLLSYPWNRRSRKHPNILRVRGWGDILCLLDDLGPLRNP